MEKPENLTEGYRNIISRCVDSPEICEDEGFWLRKSAHDLGLNPKDPQLVRIFQLPELARNVKHPKKIWFSASLRYLRTLLYYGHISNYTKQFIGDLYLAKIALYATDYSAFYKFVNSANNYHEMEVIQLGELAMHLKEYDCVVYLINMIPDYGWGLEFLHLLYTKGEPAASDAIEKFSDSDLSRLEKLYKIIMGKSQLITNLMDNEYMTRLVLTYTAKFRGFEAAEQIPGLDEFLSKQDIYIDLADVAIRVGNMEQFKKYLDLVDWNKKYYIVSLSLAITQNLEAFIDIIGKLAPDARDRFIRDIMEVLQSDNKIYKYITDTFPDVIYEFRPFGVLQDLQSYTYIISQTETLDEISDNYRIYYEPDQIVLREILKRTS